LKQDLPSPLLWNLNLTPTPKRPSESEFQFESIFSAAGLRLARVVPTAHEVSVLQGVRTD